MENDEERRAKSQELHKESQKMYDREQNALCFVVLGGIAVIIAVCFLILSFPLENNIPVFTPGSLSFALFCILIAVGAGAFAFGLTKFFMAFFRRQKIIQEINSLE